MRTILYVLVVFIIGVSAYKLGRSRVESKMYDYQIEITGDTMLIYDNGMLIGHRSVDQRCGIDSIIINNNR